jgi:hypothetical protein
MARLVCLLAFAFLLLAGCSSGPEASTEPSAPAPTVATTLGASPTTPLVTDTLHFLAFPAMTQQPPDDYAELRFPVPGFNDVLQSGASAGTVNQHVWSYDLPQDLVGVFGNVTFWVEVKGTVLNNPNPGAGGCFWEFRILTGEIDDGNFSPCVVEGTTVAPGLRAITFPIDLPGASWPAGKHVDFEFYTQDFGRDPDAKVELLTYSIDHDSRMSIAGLRLPLDPSLLLETTE